MEMAKVTSKGQITIPVSIRRRLKINEGDKLLFIDRPDGVMMVNPDLLGSAKNDIIEEASEKSNRTVAKPSTKPLPEVQKSDTTPRINTPANDKQGTKPMSPIDDFSLDSLLNEIRSIGSNI